MWEVILFFAEGLTAAELGAYSPGFIPVPGSTVRTRCYDSWPIKQGHEYDPKKLFFVTFYLKSWINNLSSFDFFCWFFPLAMILIYWVHGMIFWLFLDSFGIVFWVILKIYRKVSIRPGTILLLASSAVPTY